MPEQILHKTGMEWNGHPEAFEFRMARSEEDDPNNPGQTRIVWRLTTGYDVLTAEGERLHQDETWVLTGQPAWAEGVRTRVVNRVKQRNSIP